MKRLTALGPTRTKLVDALADYDREFEAANPAYRKLHHLMKENEQLRAALEEWQRIDAHKGLNPALRRTVEESRTYVDARCAEEITRRSERDVRKVPETELIGHRFCMLIVVAREDSSEHDRRPWKCLCDCGQTTYASHHSLRVGNKKSCGCQRHKYLHSHKRTHGGYGSLEYISWASMRGRCTNRNDPKYHLYGGRGITICERWNDFANFREDMGPRPSKKHSIDRINPNGNYEPNNCRWATAFEQGETMRRSVRVIYRGKATNATTAVRMAGNKVSLNSALYRMRRGWSVEDAVELPRYSQGPSYVTAT